MRPEDWIEVRGEGLFVKPGGFYVDPIRSVDNAVVSHGHSDHARPGHKEVVATPETLAIMRARLGPNAGVIQKPLAYRQPVTIGDVRCCLFPAGHVLGSAQVSLEYYGQRIVFSGDYKRQADLSCAPFEPVRCDVFITEATFGLPVFVHPPADREIQKLIRSVELFPERCHVVGCYALGKAQRVITILRKLGYDKPVYLHGAMIELCQLYESHGIELGELELATIGEKGKPRADLAGKIVIAPPGAIADQWARRLPDPLVAMASGWMRVKQRARQRGVELPLILSDHADWNDLMATIKEVEAEEIWVTHGREEALIHACEQIGIRARALSLIGFDEEGQ